MGAFLTIVVTYIVAGSQDAVEVTEDGLFGITFLGAQYDIYAVLPE